jgi:Bifunctional DNA primase/polymerase, N-terminal
MSVDVALKLASVGLHVFAVRIVDGDKVPRTKWRYGGVGQCSTTDENIIRKWWRWWPTDMIGIDLAKAGLLVLDGDRHPDENGVIIHDGVQALRELFRAYSLRLHPIAWTPSGGVHIYFKAPPGFGNRRGNLPPGIDVRGSGGVIIAPGSIRPDIGKEYKSDPDHPDLADAFVAGTIPDLPEFVQQIINPPRPVEPIIITPGKRGRREQAYAAKVLERNAHQLATMRPESGRNEYLNKATFRSAQMAARGWIEPKQIERVMSQAARAAALAESAITATVQSAISAGLQNPAPDLKDRRS